MAARLCAYTLTVQGGHSVIPPSRALRPRRTKTTLRIGVVIGQTIAGTKPFRFIVEVRGADDHGVGRHEVVE